MLDIRSICQFVIWKSFIMLHMLKDFSLIVIIFQIHREKPINHNLVREENRGIVVRMIEAFFGSAHLAVRPDFPRSLITTFPAQVFYFKISYNGNKFKRLPLKCLINHYQHINKNIYIENCNKTIQNIIWYFKILDYLGCMTNYLKHLD